MSELKQAVEQYIAQYTPNPSLQRYTTTPQGEVMGRFVSQGRVFSFRLTSQGIIYKPTLQQRSDAVKKQRGTKENPLCGATSYRCGVCISVSKNCRKNANNAVLKERLNKIRALAKDAHVKTGVIGKAGDRKSLMKAAQKQAQEVAKSGKTTTKPKSNIPELKDGQRYKGENAQLTRYGELYEVRPWNTLSGEKFIGDRASAEKVFNESEAAGRQGAYDVITKSKYTAPVSKAESRKKLEEFYRKKNKGEPLTLGQKIVLEKADKLLDPKLLTTDRDIRRQTLSDFTGYMGRYRGKTGLSDDEIEEYGALRAVASDFNKAESKAQTYMGVGTRYPAHPTIYKESAKPKAEEAPKEEPKPKPKEEPKISTKKNKTFSEVDKIQSEIDKIKRSKKLLSNADEKRINELNDKISEIEFANRKPAKHDEVTKQFLEGKPVAFRAKDGIRVMKYKDGVTTLYDANGKVISSEKESKSDVDAFARAIHKENRVQASLPKGFEKPSNGNKKDESPKTQGTGETEAERRQFLLNTNVEQGKPFVEPKRAIELDQVKTPQDRVKYATQELAIAKASKDNERINKWIEELQRAKKAVMGQAQVSANTYQPELFFVNKGNPNQRSLFDSISFDAEYDDSVERNILNNIGLMISRAMSGSQSSPNIVQLRKVRYANGNVSGVFTQYGSQYDFVINSKGVVISPLQVRQDRIAGIPYKKTAKIGANRKCGRGYKCKGTCISKNNKCRVNWASKEGLEQYKSMIKELDALTTTRFIEVNGRQVAQRRTPEEDAKTLAMARRVAEARGARQAFSEDYKAKTGKYYKTIADRVNAEVERRLKDANISPTKVKSTLAELDPKDIAVDPKRFQYKIVGEHTATGTVGSLQGVGKWDENLAGILQVWKDPEDGKTYVVNGHNRLAKANELGADKVAVRYLEVPSHQEARTIGAMTNIAEGRGTALDAAKFFRDTNWTKEDLLKKGIPLKEKIATDGLAIAALEPNLFRQVIDGDLPMERASIIGGAGLSHEKQRSLMELVNKRKNINNAVLSELIDTVKYSGQKQEQQFDLFGGSTAVVDLAVQRASLQSFIKQKLSSEKKLFGTVSKSKSAKDLERGGNIIDTGKSGEIASQAETALKIFDTIKHSVGGVSDVLNQGAERIANARNKSEKEKINKEIYENVLKAIQSENDKLFQGRKTTDSRQRSDSDIVRQFAAQNGFKILTYAEDRSGNIMGVLQYQGKNYRFIKPLFDEMIIQPVRDTNIAPLFELAPDLTMGGCL